MANLYARVMGDDSRYTARQGHEQVVTSVETWAEKIVVYLGADGSFRVSRRDKDMNVGGEVLARGHLELGTAPARRRRS